MALSRFYNTLRNCYYKPTAMYKYFFLLVLVVAVSACKKNNQQKGCSAKACTYEFVSIAINFVDKDGKPVPGTDVKVINKRTNKQIIAGSNGPAVPGVGPNVFFIATDSNKNDFSTEGDDVEVTAANATTGNTKTTLFKISGGCNCHVAKISGPDKIVLE